MQRMISLRQRQNAEARALLGASWPLSWPAIGLSPAEKHPAILLPFYLRQSKWLNVGWHGKGLISTLQIKGSCLSESRNGESVTSSSRVGCRGLILWEAAFQGLFSKQ